MHRTKIAKKRKKVPSRLQEQTHPVKGHGHNKKIKLCSSTTTAPESTVISSLPTPLSPSSSFPPSSDAILLQNKDKKPNVKKKTSTPSQRHHFNSSAAEEYSRASSNPIFRNPQGDYFTLVPKPSISPVASSVSHSCWGCAYESGLLTLVKTDPPFPQSNSQFEFRSSFHDRIPNSNATGMNFQSPP